MGCGGSKPKKNDAAAGGAAGGADGGAAGAGGAEDAGKGGDGGFSTSCTSAYKTESVPTSAARALP